MTDLDVVSHALTLASYVPADQEEKTEILADIAFLLEPAPPSATSRPPPTIAQQISALEQLHSFLAQDWIASDESSLGASVRKLHTQLTVFLERIDADVSAAEALARLEDVLLASFPAQLSRLRAALEPQEITLDSLPEGLRRRMLSPVSCGS